MSMLNPSACSSYWKTSYWGPDVPWPRVEREQRYLNVARNPDRIVQYVSMEKATLSSVDDGSVLRPRNRVVIWQAFLILGHREITGVGRPGISIGRVIIGIREDS